MKQRIIKNYKGQKLVYPTKPDLHIKNLLSEEECMYFRKLSEMFPKKIQHPICSVTKTEHRVNMKLTDNIGRFQRVSFFGLKN